MYTATADLILPSTTTGSFPRPRWYDVNMWGRPLDTCMLDVRFREKFQDAMAVLISDQERAGLDVLTHGDLHVDEDLAGRAWHHYPLQRWAGFEGDHLQPEATTAPWLHYPPGTLLNEIYTGWRWPHVVDKIEHRSLDYAKLWRLAQGRTRKPVKFGTCCSQVMALFLDIHTPKYKDKRQVIWDMAEAMNKELLALRDAGCRCIQIEEPTFHFMANTYGKDHDEVKFMIDAFNREVQGLDDVELWIHTCWGNPNMQRVMEDTSYANSIEIYLERCRGDVWTLEMKDRGQKDLELFAPFQERPEKEGLHRRRQSPFAAGRSSRGSRRGNPQGAEVYSGRKADRIERLWLWPPGLQSRDCLLQGKRDRARLQHCSQGTRAEFVLHSGGGPAAPDRRGSGARRIAPGFTPGLRLRSSEKSALLN